MESQSEYAHVALTFFFACSGADLHARSALVDETSASELSRRFVMSAVGCWLGKNCQLFLRGSITRKKNIPETDRQSFPLFFGGLLG